MAIEPHRKDSPFGHQCCDPQEQLRKEILLDQFFKEKPGLSNLQQAKDIDSHLGFKIPKIERKLLKKYRAYYKKSDSSNSKGFHSESETWVGLHPQVLLTPYAEIHRFLTFLKSYDPKIVVDLGAAYRRIGIVMSNILPTAQFKGFEIVTERLEEAKRVYASLLLENCQIEHQNILDDSFEIPDADIYFIYDFSKLEDINLILRKMYKKIQRRNFFVVAKGDTVRTLIEAKFPRFWSNQRPIHSKEWSIYSTSAKLNFSLSRLEN